MSDTWDVVVAGAGMGGLALATRLGRLGCRVLVVERRLPSPGAPVPFRVGESLDWEAPIYLRRLGISLEQLVAEGKATATPFWTCSFQDMVAHQSAGENWIAIGEAAFVVDAILSSGVTLALRTGFFAARIIAQALAGGGETLSPKWRRIYHEKTAASAGTVNGLIDVLWYRGRLRAYYPLMLNVASILVFNFNLNHLHTRYTPHTLFELRLLKLLHCGIDRFVPAYDAYMTGRAHRKARLTRRSELDSSPGEEAGCRVSDAAAAGASCVSEPRVPASLAVIEEPG